MGTDEAKHRAHVMFQRVNEANEVLGDAAKKANYMYTQRFTAPAPASHGYGASAYGASAYGGSAYASPAKWPYGRSYEDDDDDDGHL